MKRQFVRSRSLFALAMLLGIPYFLSAQYTVHTGGDPTEMVKETLIGPAIQVRNVKFTGNPDALGTFENPAATPGFEKGLIISSGKAADVAGPNDQPKMSTVNARTGDKDLYMLAKGRTFDAALLEFDMQTARDSLVVNFIFASEEYNDYVGSTFSDAITIQVSGPGFPNGKNLAVLPGTNTPVNVNTVNYNTNGKYYQDNNPFTLAGRISEKRKAELNPQFLENFQFDGMTKVMSVGTKVKPKSTYRVKIGIADAGDGNVDSALLIEAGSFQSVEQYRWVLRRQKIAEQRRQDSLARVAFVADSLAREQAIRDSIAAQIALQEAASDSLIDLDLPREPVAELPDAEIAPDPRPTRPDTEMIDAPDTREEIDDPFSEPDARPRLPERPKTLTVDGPYRRPPGPDDAQEYKAVIRYREDDIIVPEASERLLKDIALFMRNYPDLKLGIYVPGATDNAKLRYDLIRLEMIKAGVQPERVFRNGFGFLSPDESGSQHRAEILVRPAE